MTQRPEAAASCWANRPDNALHAGVLPNGVNKENQYTKEVDIFAFGLIILELATRRKLEASNCASWPQLLDSLQDADCKAFIHW